MSQQDRTERAEQQARIDAKAAAFVVRRDSAPSAALEAELCAWIEADPAHAVAFARADANWQAMPRVRLDADHPLAPDAGHLPVRSVAARAGAAVPFLTRRRALAAAASVAAIAALGWYRYTPAERRSTGFGERAIKSLADGSTIALNTETSLTIALGRTQRAIVLEKGEAFFEVARDPDRPFTVEAPDVRVRVLGTKFNVSRSGDTTRVAVTEGSVAVTGPDGTVHQLTRNSLAEITASSVAIRHNDAFAVERSIAWREGFIQFDGERLADVLAQFNRYRAKPLHVASGDLADLSITGRFGVNESREFLQALESSFGLVTRTGPSGIEVVRKGDAGRENGSVLRE
ncbi:FecR family protein [Novosphingobium decolorationis]|uniref:FecR domain-containing protein n=1 Tax=Novosphingobium decolorationis TaxID=2698673 RepID=A0ABX8E4M0_9SPHN|nr:FecR domain-containing protein [Novosphingobium decolorationis]MED5543959.1 FecR domain-containing protein [Pseudomonadota bacterium]QVM84132.1 FecR domain-containing protein [Novosphingobium decolorationis]